MPRLPARGEAIAIIAGSGSLPGALATAIEASGRRAFILAIEGEGGANLDGLDWEPLGWGQVGLLFKKLSARNIRHVMLAGGISRRPEVGLRRMDWGTVRTLSSVLGAMLGGDNTLLTGVISVFEKRGLTVLGVADVAPHLLAQLGANGAAKPRRKDLERLRHGGAVTHALGAFDIGQGAVIVGSRAVAVEGIEGTDAMLERISHLRVMGRLSAKRGGVLVKTCKPGQDLRADLPSIGPKTIKGVAAAGLNGVGVEAGKTIILDREETLELALRHGIFIYGMAAEAFSGEGT